MDESAANNSFNPNNSILISRNRPIAFVVNVSSFLGSHVADKLLEKGIQVIGVADFEFGEKRNIAEALKNKDFHLINDTIKDPKFVKNETFLKLPRLDYAFFPLDKETQEGIITHGLVNFLEFIKKTKELSVEGEKEKHAEKLIAEKPRVVLMSSIDLYDSKLNHEQKVLKEAEVRFAKFVKYYKINARVVRLANVYGPRMNFASAEPVTRLIQAALTDKLQEEQAQSDFSDRSLYVGDAISLIIKSVLSGATAHKIYDGALIQPVKVSEIKQILLDPMWHEMRGFQPTELPPWPTPNLQRTMKELAWESKTGIIEGLKETIAYFKDNNIEVERVDEKEDFRSAKNWSFKESGESEQVLGFSEQEEKGSGEEKVERRKQGKWGSKVPYILVGILIVYALLFPVLSLGYGAFNIRNSLKNSKQYLEEGNFDRARQEIKGAENTLKGSEELVGSLALLKKIKGMDEKIGRVEQMISLLEEGVEGVSHATEGSAALFQTTKIISGEDRSEPLPYYEKAQTELTIASQKISKVQAAFEDKEFTAGFPLFITTKIEDTKVKLNLYSVLIEQARAAAFLMPKLTAIGEKKSYLVLLQNNLELRPTGGFIGSYGKFDFDNGRLSGIKVDDIYNLDGGLKDVIEPPAELKSDLGINRWFLRDSNFDPDFPTSARQAEFFYKREGGEAVNGVIALDLGASSALLGAVGGIDLPEYGEHVDGNNLFERAITHAEVNFFPGSQEKKNYLTSLQTQLFNKIFYLSKQNWPAIISAIGASLEQKHMLVYLEDPSLFSYLASSNWSGVMPRGAENQEGESKDFLAAVEANLGANKSNYFLQRKYDLETTISKEGQVSHKLKINYRNTSPSEVFPAGKYKDRMRVYLPVGTKLNKAIFGENEITSSVTSFSDYGRAGFSFLIELAPKEQKSLILEYTLPNSLNFKDNSTNYRLEVFKQAGTDKDSFEWTLHYPINFKIESSPLESKLATQELRISTDLLTDRTFLLKIKK